MAARQCDKACMRLAAVDCARPKLPCVANRYMNGHALPDCFRCAVQIRFGIPAAAFTFLGAASQGVVGAVAALNVSGGRDAQARSTLSHPELHGTRRRWGLQSRMHVVCTIGLWLWQHALKAAWPCVCRCGTALATASSMLATPSRPCSRCAALPAWSGRYAQAQPWPWLGSPSATLRAHAAACHGPALLASASISLTPC